MEGIPNDIVALAQVAYVLFVVGAFLRLPARRAVLVAVLGGFLFLPVFDNTAYEPTLLRTKEMFVPGVVFAASLVFDWRRWVRFRPRLIDVPIAVLCLAPIATSISNDLGAYDGLHRAYQVMMAWGTPYLLGRVYLTDLAGMRDLAETVVAAALVYMPLCLWEVRMSPQLHHSVYGYRPYAGFAQSVRFGGFRPTVFMNHGLMVGMFMAGGALLAFWLWRVEPRRRILGIPLGWATVTLMLTSLLTKSVGSNLLLAVGIGSIALSRRFRTATMVLVLAAVPPAYAVARLSGWSAQEVVRLTRNLVNADRAQSLEFRIWNEGILIAKAMERPGLGWGGWGRGRVFDEDGKDISTTDGLWVIALSAGGLLALAMSLLVVIVPAIAFWSAMPARKWGNPRLAPPLAVLVWLLLWGIDNVTNSMLSPVFMLAAGALASLQPRTRAANSIQGRRRVSGDVKFTQRESHPVVSNGK